MKEEIHFLHYIDHEGFGTIHKLINPLCDIYTCHNLIKYKCLNRVKFSENDVLIIHSTGHISYDVKQIINSKYLCRHVFIFLHTSFYYQKLKGREEEIIRLMRWMNENKMILLVPSQEVQKQYMKVGFKCYSIQLGVKDITNDDSVKNDNDSLKKYYKKYITTCSSEKEIYRYVKGIDLYVDLIKEKKLSNEALVAGLSKECEMGVYCERFEENDFLNILFHSKAYIQLSRFETYNITAVYAKQMGIPIFVLGVEGVKNCLGDIAYENYELLSDGLDEYICRNNCRYDLSEIKKESLYRESLSSMAKSFSTLLKDVEEKE